MFGSWNLGKLAGIEVRVHWTFLLLPLWIYFSSLVSGSGAFAASVAVLLLLAIFGCVLLHEFGHALMARRFGIPTQDITLLPIGGVARLQRMPRVAWQELAIAVAGPAVNVGIALVLFVALSVSAIGGLLPSGVALFLSKLAVVNVALVVFNMLPAFPMDGGRVLRAVLAMVMPYVKATQVAARVGQIAAAGLAVLGLLSGNLVLVLLAGFVFLAARGESMMVTREQQQFGSDYAYTAENQPPHSTASKSPLRSLPVVNAAWNARNVLGWLPADSLDEFLVASHGVVIGIVHKSDLSDAVRSGFGAWPMEHLLASHSLPFHEVQA